MSWSYGFSPQKECDFISRTVDVNCAMFQILIFLLSFCCCTDFRNPLTENGKVWARAVLHSYLQMISLDFFMFLMK